MKYSLLLITLFSFFCSQAQYITTVAGGGSNIPGNGGAATSCVLSAPTCVIADISGNFFFCERDGHKIRKVTTDGTITTIAGTGVMGCSGDGGAATSALISRPYSLAINRDGDIIFSDGACHSIRKINTDGVISTIAGTGDAGYNADAILATNAKLDNPSGIAVDNMGNIYIADFNNNRIRKIDTSGIISTFAGTGEILFNGDNIPATNANIHSPAEVAIDGLNNVYTTVRNHNRVRKINSSGYITTIAGNGTAGFSGDSSAATLANINFPVGICLDMGGNVIFSDVLNNRIRRVNSSGNISTVVGSGLDGFYGDGGNPLLARISNPLGVSVNASGNLYIVDRGNNRIRLIEGLLSLSQHTLPSTSLSLYPVPTLGNLTIHLTAPTSSTASIIVTDIQGRVVQQALIPTNTPYSIILSAPPGMYTITAHTHLGVISQSLSLLH